MTTAENADLSQDVDGSSTPYRETRDLVELKNVSWLCSIPL